MIIKQFNRYREYWNKCTYCGKFIAYRDFRDKDGALTRMLYPDSEFTIETWETICKKCREGENEATKNMP